MKDVLTELGEYLAPLPLGGWEFHPVVSSTNDLALERARLGAPDWTLILADKQTAGRGRAGRQWVTHPQAALAMSFVLRPSPEEMVHFSRFSALAALSLVSVLEGMGLTAVVKWPNDVLLDGRKTAGVLVEAVWEGEDLQALVVGMGVNVRPAAVPPPSELRFPAVDIESVAGVPVDRWALLAALLRSMMDWRKIMVKEAFMRAWNDRLAFKGRVAALMMPDGSKLTARVQGVSPDGRLILRHQDGKIRRVSAGEIEIAYN